MSLSRNQTNRLAGLLGVMSHESLPDKVSEELLASGYIQAHGDAVILTEKGLDEKNRLCTLAGLNIRYMNEKKPSTREG